MKSRRSLIRGASAFTRQETLDAIGAALRGIDASELLLKETFTVRSLAVETW